MRQNEPLEIRKTIRRRQMREMAPLADSIICEIEQSGEYPRRFALSPRCIVRDLAEVHAWLLARRAKPIQIPEDVVTQDQACRRAGLRSGTRSRQQRGRPTVHLG